MTVHIGSRGAGNITRTTEAVKFSVKVYLLVEKERRNVCRGEEKRYVLGRMVRIERRNERSGVRAGRCGLEKREVDGLLCGRKTSV
jgi:hypothetical protein